ncbi:hypothetical protein WICANDRAFT_80307 [Wickerhamomyces anomalus NRRL Y-366-8]|uniref:Uncharacterized protein n=1 Tax=Wickerhamomyces anomalus (strain ATCC 58044 / CBS 1984 / NCYC 433 / NRRL Y-366-8) TaxID=683960 RepID=A0A1E3NYR5_WICAA|nr:uncharacterized protein WICANDRAFT_80307 [Wickerhamomyces anomalus NRRL Y-366-8]ODQ58150.1 hypothetical protein WICANDRAFT_80307 [Wickerhamomyces anomalus NRRL Y-366-8]
MFYKIITGLVLLLCASLSLADGSQNIGSLQVTPLDYDKYAETIDLKLLRFFDSNEVFFYDSEAKTYDSATQTVRNASILSTGQFTIGQEGKDYYLTINPVSGVVSVSKDSKTSNGLFYINDNYLYYQYHKLFVACKSTPDAHNYTLTWRGASSPAICQNDWLLIYLKPYGSSNGTAISSYYPNEYAASIASTATDNTDTSTVTAPVTTGSSKASANGANAHLVGIESGVSRYSGLSVLIVVLISFIF